MNLINQQVKPFLKWAGGKAKMLPHLLPKIPVFHTYHEPFAGGAALYFALQPSAAILSDANSELIATYRAVRDDVDGVIEALNQHYYERDYYHFIRSLDPKRLTAAERAARFIFLNRTCFNGLYRVNQKGKFNVSFGRYVNPLICNEPLLRACSEALQATSLMNCEFDQTLELAQPGDFAYFDPPYVPISRTANFGGYTAGGFSQVDQERLAATARQLSSMGVWVMLSNSDTPLVHQLYEGFTIQVITGITRAINSSPTKRACQVSEVLITNY